eukprot:7365336-Pyramimonas_sp.AAC.1
MGCASPTAPGPGGLPRAAWQQTRIAGPVLFDVLQVILGGRPPPIELNEPLRAFALKGRRADDTSLVLREPAPARPLALKRTDAKILASACSHS